MGRIAAQPNKLTSEVKEKLQTLVEGVVNTLDITQMTIDQTLYSYRHSGAIEIFKGTGSITKLQKAMGHSSINVSLTYLRGLEVPELTEEDMPIINLKNCNRIYW